MFPHGKIPNRLICKTRTYKVKMLLSGWPSSQREDVHQQENDQVLGGIRRLFAWWHWGSTWPFCTYLVSRWQILKNDICILTIRYLNWIGMETKVFNLGDYRRIRCSKPARFWGIFLTPICRTIQGTKGGRARLDQDHQFFDHSNPEGMKIREEVNIFWCDQTWPRQVCEEALEDVFDWLSGGGEVAVFDATNTTRQCLMGNFCIK